MTYKNAWKLCAMRGYIYHVITMDGQDSLPTGRIWEGAEKRVGTTSEARAQWLWNQLARLPPATTSSQNKTRSKATRNEWTVFLFYEGVPYETSLTLADGYGAIAEWKDQINRALRRLSETGATENYTVRIERTWKLSNTHITPRRAPLHQDNPEDVSSLVVAIALDCLASRLRRCAKPSCREMFMATGKKKYCSLRCAHAVAKQGYRKRNREQNRLS